MLNTQDQNTVRVKVRAATTLVMRRQELLGERIAKRPDLTGRPHWEEDLEELGAIERQLLDALSYL